GVGSCSVENPAFLRGRRYSAQPGVAARTPGETRDQTPYAEGVTAHSPGSRTRAPREEKRGFRVYAEGVTAHSPGTRTRAPRAENRGIRVYAEGVTAPSSFHSAVSIAETGRCNAFGVNSEFTLRFPGCAARPRAVRCNAFGVKNKGLRQSRSG